MAASSVAVIDIGSNSIKVLVATRDARGALTPLRVRTIDARISAGISQTQPQLSEAGMTRGVKAVQALLAEAAPFAPATTVLVATSAVRDAGNGRDFCARVRGATGGEIRVLTGDEEANLIGRGLTADPTLQALQDFYVFDLGGGSLECLAFRQRRIEQAASLKLGCVRLTEKFITDSAQPLPSTAMEAIAAYTREEITHAGFAFSLPTGVSAVGTGGTVTTVRAIFGAREGRPFEATAPLVTISQLRELLAWLGSLSLVERKKIPGLPPARADVFPAALATLVALTEVGGFGGYVNSLYSLRYGVADEALPLQEKRP